MNTLLSLLGEREGSLIEFIPYVDFGRVVEQPLGRFQLIIPDGPEQRRFPNSYYIVFSLG